VHSLPLFVRLKGRPVILLGEGEAADAKRRLLDRAGAIVSGEDAEAALAIIAIDDDEEAKAAIARIKTRGILVNAVDRPTACDFTLPAIVDRDPVIIAVGTGGASAGLAKAIRIRLEALLPPTLGTLATALSKARQAMRTRWPDGRQRRIALDTAFQPGKMLDPLATHDEASVDRWIASGGDTPASQFFHIELTSTDPDDLTLKQARLLGQADRVYHTTDVPAAILKRARADAEVIARDAPVTDQMGLTLFITLSIMKDAP
jgi:uroporphyrin-III C-methyltransferase / precorrin-2 dehydrogenase / sirohydrochlorin ferrochelatase